MNVGIIGTGKVGRTLGLALVGCGYPLVGVASRRVESAQAFALDAATVAFDDLAALVNQCDVIFVTVPDDALAVIGAAFMGVIVSGKTFLHTSGAHSLDVFAALSDAGARVGSLHPALPFASVGEALQHLPGVTWALEYRDPQTEHLLRRLVADLQGVALVVPAGAKARYHAALCLASNYAVTLYALAEEMLMTLGASKEHADNALNRLIEATTANLITLGVPQALTGPLVRGDVGTVSAHLTALDPMTRELYRQLALHTLPLVRARGVATKDLEQLLQKESSPCD